MPVPQGAMDMDLDRRNDQRHKLISCWSGASGAKYFRFRKLLPANELPLERTRCCTCWCLGTRGP